MPSTMLVLIAALRQPGRCIRYDGTAIEPAAGIASFRIGASGGLTLMHQNDVDVGSEQLFWADFAPLWQGADKSARDEQKARSSVILK